MKILRAEGVLLGVLLGVFAFADTASAGSIGVVPDGGCLAYPSSGGPGAVYFCDTDIRPTGTGFIDPFLRVNRDGKLGADPDGTPATYSSGWNTGTGAPNIVDLVDPGANDYDFEWSNALAAGDLGYDTPPPLLGEDPLPLFAVFTVDINQKGNQNALGDLLSLNHFELFNCSSNDYESLSECNGGVSFFNLFNTGDWVTFDYRNHEGSGSGDIDVYIPSTAGFGTEYIALLDGWGCGITGLTCDTSNAEGGLFPDNDGFQEWISAGAPPPNGSGNGTGQAVVPEPASLLLLGAGLGLAAATARRRNKKRQPIQE